MPDDKKPLPPAATGPFKQPPVSVGDIVMWAQRDGSQGCPAIVTSLGSRSVNVTRIPDDAPRVYPMRGARHVSDPDLRTMIECPMGAWDYTQAAKKLQELLG